MQRVFFTLFGVLLTGCFIFANAKHAVDIRIVPAPGEAKHDATSELRVNTADDTDQATTSRSSVIEPLIAYGDDAAESQFPFVLSLLKPSSTGGGGYYHGCTAILIAPTVFLTAAHCLYDPTTKALYPPTIALLGGVDLTSPNSFEEIKGISDFIIHPSYTLNGFDTIGADIAVGLLDSPSTIQPTKIATSPSTYPTPGALLTAVGFGIDETYSTTGIYNRLLKSTKLIAYGTACPLQLPDGVICTAGLLKNDGAYSGYSGTCSGDSGGPLLSSNGLPVGITSYGPRGDCGSILWSASTLIPYYYTSFIKPAMKKLTSPAPPPPKPQKSPPPPKSPPPLRSPPPAPLKCTSWTLFSNKKIDNASGLGGVIHVASAAECGDECKSTTNCSFFNFVKDSKNCKLYKQGSKVVTKSNSASTTAGVMICVFAARLLE